jgi:hypothetical protein
VSTADRITHFCADPSWSGDTVSSNGWSSECPACLDVTSPGIHTINVWMREDGLQIDRILLTTASGYTPSGAGPDESRQWQWANLAGHESSALRRGKSRTSKTKTLQLRDSQPRISPPARAGSSGEGAVATRR